MEDASLLSGKSFRSYHALKVLFEMERALNAIEDSGELQARPLDLSFEMIPGFRGGLDAPAKFPPVGN